MRADKCLLTKPGHLPRLFPFIPCDQLSECSHGRVFSERRKVGVESCFEFIVENDSLGIVKLSCRREFHRVDNGRACAAQCSDRLIESRVDGVVETGEMPRRSDACALEAGGIEKRCIIRRAFAAACICCVIARINASEYTEQGRCVGDRTRHRAGSVL